MHLTTRRIFAPNFLFYTVIFHIFMRKHYNFKQFASSDDLQICTCPSYFQGFAGSVASWMYLHMTTFSNKSLQTYYVIVKVYGVLADCSDENTDYSQLSFPSMNILIHWLLHYAIFRIHI